MLFIVKKDTFYRYIKFCFFLNRTPHHSKMLKRVEKLQIESSAVDPKVKTKTYVRQHCTPNPTSYPSLGQIGFVHQSFSSS